MDISKNIFNEEFIDTKSGKGWDLLFNDYKLVKQSPELIKEKYMSDNPKDIVWIADKYWYHKRQLLDQQKR